MRLRIFSGDDRAGVLAAVEAGEESDTGPARLVIVDPADAERAARWLRSGGPQPRGVAFRAAPISGEVAFVYTNGAAAYDGMGRELAAALPDLAGTVLGDGGESRVLGRLMDCARLGLLHTAIARTLFGLWPSAAIGYSFGETVALIAMEVWQDPGRLIADLCAGSLYTADMAGELRAVRAAWRDAGIEGDRWASLLVRTDRARLAAALAAEPAVHLLVVSAPGLFVIGGEATATARVGRLFGDDALPIDHELAVHVPELAGIADRLRRGFTGPVRPVTGTRLYSGVTARSYEVTAERVAEAMTDLHLRTVDFPALIEQAYADGVRIFVEMGPRRQCTGFIDRILDGRDHVAVAMDEPGRGIDRLWRTAAELAAAGIRVDAAAVAQALSRQVMVPPPALPPVLPQPGPVLDRSGLDELAQGRVSAAFGPEHSHLDGLRHRVRLPRGPMLLLDRVTGVHAVPMSRGGGTIHAETEVRPDSWFLDSGGRMPAGLMAEAMQGALALISWLGLDPGTGDQSARLLDQEVVFHGPRPRVGETLRHVTRVGEHFEHDGMVLVSVSGESYVGDELRMSLRGGRVGVYSRTGGPMGGGLVWEPKPGGGSGAARAFGEADIAALGLPMPRDGRLRMLREVPEFDPQRGYLRAAFPISPDDWYFDAHFPNDPVMPGNLMWQLGFQAASFYLAALGHTAGRADWEFDMVPEQPMKIRFRDQATPASRLFDCELFVTEVIDEPYPTVRGDLLLTVDGVKSGLCQGAAVRLVPAPAFQGAQPR
jgi:3-hydroxymyristoyl/3-hydroxydecanoyl-(acyl carrier protein) dehydratase/malonyl CoA-acyl carrier protein transacylase